MTRLSTRQWFVLGVLAWLTTLAAMTDSQAHAAHKPGDPWTAEYMWRRYHNTTPNCPGNSEAPEYDCTGILLRGTSPQKEPQGGWVPEQKSYGSVAVKSSAGGVSFSYIRADSKFKNLAFYYQNGFTLLPFSGKYTYPKDGSRMSITVLCAYPLDAGTDHRGFAGCSDDFAKHPNPSQTWNSCQTSGVNTADDWFKRFMNESTHYNPRTNWLYYGQCGFDMRDDHRRPSDFTAVLQAMGKIPGHWFTDSIDNELRVATWGMSQDENAHPVKPYLPIESFFYIAGSSNGLKNAQYDQKRWYAATQPNAFIPIIRITPPSPTTNGHFDFEYRKQDQIVKDIPTFPSQDPYPCTVGNFDTECPK